MSPLGFEPTFPASAGLKAHALDRAASEVVIPLLVNYINMENKHDTLEICKSTLIQIQVETNNLALLLVVLLLLRGFGNHGNEV
jgi:hypothetical protein